MQIGACIETVMSISVLTAAYLVLQAVNSRPSSQDTVCTSTVYKYILFYSTDLSIFCHFQTLFMQQQKVNMRPYLPLCGAQYKHSSFTCIVCLGMTVQGPFLLSEFCLQMIKLTLAWRPLVALPSWLCLSYLHCHFLCPGEYSSPGHYACHKPASTVSSSLPIIMILTIKASVSYYTKCALKGNNPSAGFYIGLRFETSSKFCKLVSATSCADLTHLSFKVPSEAQPIRFTLYSTA